MATTPRPGRRDSHGGGRGSLPAIDSIIDGNVSTLTGGGGDWRGRPHDPDQLSLVSNNHALRGGGLDQYYGDVTVRRSTFWSNDADVYGGAIFQRGGTLTLDGAAILMTVPPPSAKREASM